MKKKVISTKKAFISKNSVSQALVCSFDKIFSCSGQIGIDPETGEMGSSTEEQVSRTMYNIGKILEEAGADFSNVLKTNIFLTNLEDSQIVDATYRKFFNPPFPTRSMVEVTRLPKNAKVEIEVWGVL